MTFDFFAWWGEGRNAIEDEIKAELRILLTQHVGWLEFNRSYGNVIEQLEMEPNNSLLQVLVRAHIVESVHEYNVGVPEDRQVVVSQNFINFRQEDERLDMDLTFYIAQNLKRQDVTLRLGG